MDTAFDNCPHCGSRLLKGALRCVKCGRILKTPEEQMASIKKLKQTKKKSHVGIIIDFIFLLLATGVVYHFFSERIIEFIKSILTK